MHGVFDVDGVLLRSWRWRDFLLSEHGLPPERTHAYYSGPFLECLVGQADLYATLAQALPSWGLPYSVEECVARWFELESEPIPGVLELVRRLAPHAASLSIATNQERHRTRYIWETLGYRDVFQHMFSSSALGVTKPDPRFYRHIEQALSADPASIVFVDDSPANVQAAQMAGWRAYLFEGPQTLAVLAALVDG